MAAVTIRHIPEETHRALEKRAARNGQSVESEIRAILEEAVRPPEPLGIGSQLEALGKQYGGINLDSGQRDIQVEPASFK